MPPDKGPTTTPSIERPMTMPPDEHLTTMPPDEGPTTMPSVKRPTQKESSSIVHNPLGSVEKEVCSTSEAGDIIMEKEICVGASIVGDEVDGSSRLDSKAIL